MIALFSLVLFIGWGFYWKVAEQKADKEKPKQKVKTFEKWAIFVGTYFMYFFVVFQLLGIISLLYFPKTLIVQLVGLCAVILGMTISISARIVLSANWANGYEYQIKRDHELITHGIYHFVRHPIYSGMIISLIGAELVASSWLWLFCFFCFIPLYIQGKREEKLLIAHYGEKYRMYIRHSKMFVPFVF